MRATSCSTPLNLQYNLEVRREVDRQEKYSYSVSSEISANCRGVH